MANLIYYTQERLDFKEAYDKEFESSLATRIVFKKLLKHFKLFALLEWTSGRNHPKAFYSGKIRLNIDINNFGVLCHELAHLLQNNKYHKRGHNKQHKKLMRKIINYCEKKEWFEEEIERRLTPKIKSEPTEAEMKADNLIKAQQKIVRYEKKILFYQRKLSKAKRSYALKLAWQDRNKENNTIENAHNSSIINEKALYNRLVCLKSEELKC